MVFLIQYPQKRSDFEYQTHFRSGKVCVKECYYLKQCRMPYMYGKYKKTLFQFVIGGHILPNISTNKLKIDGPVIISYSVHLKNSKTVIDYSLRSILKFFAYFLQRYRSWEISPYTISVYLRSKTFHNLHMQQNMFRGLYHLVNC